MMFLLMSLHCLVMHLPMSPHHLMKRAPFVLQHHSPFALQRLHLAALLPQVLLPGRTIEQGSLTDFVRD
jgi:hypothetical protein